MASDNTGTSEFMKKMKQAAKDGTLKTVLRDWRWIWSFTRRHWRAVLLYTLCGILSGALSLAAGVVSKYMIDSIVTLDLSRLLPYCILTAVSAVLGVVFQGITSRFSAKLSLRMYNDVQAQVFDSILEADWMAISAYSSGDLLNRFSGDVTTVANCAVNWLPDVTIQLFTVLATLGVILYFDPIMALIACASTPILFLTSRRLLRKQRSYSKSMRQVSSDMAAFQSETFRNIDTLKSFGVEEQTARRLRLHQEAYRSTVLEHNRFTIRTNILLTALGTAVQYAALAYCLWRLWRGDILFGTMTLFLQQRTRLSSAFSSLVSLIPTTLSGSVAAERIRELTSLAREPGHTEQIIPHGSCSIEITNVQVSYRQDHSVLSDVAFFAPAGQVVALVGPSGEGKTTLLRLLLGLIRPERGELTLVDAEGNRYPLGADTRRCFTYVPQGNTLIAGTVAENLLLAKEDASETDMIAALQDACAWEFVKALPMGLETPIGEGGKGLSEGQAQRIAIARALMRSAPLMLLDEVTSALDQQTEQQVLENLMRRGVTTVVTTHRPSVLEMCSGIYRVQGGKVQPISKEAL